MPFFVVYFGFEGLADKVSREWGFTAQNREDAEEKAQKLADKLLKEHNLKKCEIKHISGPKSEIRIS